MINLNEIKKAIGADGLTKKEVVIKTDTKINTFIGKNANDYEIFNWCINEHKKNKFYTDGNRNAFISSLAVFCCEYGVNEQTCINESINQLKENDQGDKIDFENVIKSVYKNHSNIFGTKKYVPKTTYIEIKETKNKTITKATPNIENIFLIRTANDCINQAKMRPIPKCLFSEFWHENELSILFAGAGIGKTILAVQIANSISKGLNIRGFKNEAEQQKILYFDFELSDKQFENRYSENYTNHFVFDDNFIRVEINPDAENFNEQLLYDSIEKTILQTNAKILIIDNITYLKNNLETSKDALPLMKNLKQFKKKYNLSILALAHTPKRDLTRHVTINDLSGSSMIGNFADSIFTINQSSKDKSLRYIKQIKARATEIIFDTDNVILCEIKNDYNFTCLEFIDFGNETEHLKEVKEFENNEVETSIIEINKKNPEKSFRDIAKELNTNQMKVKRTLDKFKQK